MTNSDEDLAALRARSERADRLHNEAKELVHATEKRAREAAEALDEAAWFADLPPNATVHRVGGSRVAFAVIGDPNEPEEFFIRDSAGKWHCVESWDYSAAYIWNDWGADLEIKEKPSGGLTVCFRDWPGGARIGLFPITWPHERSKAG